MDYARIAATRFHVTASGDELVTGSNSLDAAVGLALNVSAGRKCAMHVSDTQTAGYIRIHNGRILERINL